MLFCVLGTVPSTVESTHASGGSWTFSFLKVQTLFFELQCHIPPVWPIYGAVFRLHGPQVKRGLCSHKDVSTITSRRPANDSSCEAGMHCIRADSTLTSHSRVLLIKIYI